MSTRPVYINRDIRVLIQKDLSKVTLSGSIVNINDENGNPIFQSKSPLLISRNLSGLTVNGRVTQRRVLHFSSDTNVMNVQGRSYRGKVIVLENQFGKLLVVNQLPMEHYLRGVVASEMSEKAPLEALKAQAVAARTYALHHMIVHTKFSYDLNLPENTQAYRGLAGEYPQSDRAILETQGMVLEYKGEIFPSFFYTQCGGYTEEASVLWPAVGVAPRSTRCEPCLKNQNITWKFWIRNADLRKKLMNAGYKIPHDFQMILHRNPKTQRMMFVQIGEEYIPAHKLRNILGVTKVKSTFFWIKMGMYSMRFYGRGWGHGVGLCQSGAIQLAKEDYSFTEILKYYYPKSRCIESQ